MKDAERHVIPEWAAEAFLLLLAEATRPGYHCMESGYQSLVFVSFFQGKAHPDSEAVRPAVAVFESSSEAFRAVLDDGEPEAGSAWVGCGGMPAVEGFAQRRQIFCRDADTRVNY